MPLIYCETTRITKNQFELTRSEWIGAGLIGETVETWTDENNDRLLSAIVNVGFACKTFADRAADIITSVPVLQIVGIESDIDGKDHRNGGEHDILFSLLVPKDDEQGRKMRSLYYDYERYLDRIMQLAMRHGIKFVLQVRGESVGYN